MAAPVGCVIRRIRTGVSAGGAEFWLGAQLPAQVLEATDAGDRGIDVVPAGAGPIQHRPDPEPGSGTTH